MLIAGIALVIVILAGALTIYPMLAGSDGLPAPVPSGNNEQGLGNTTGGSWVEIITDQPTPVPTTDGYASAVPTTILPTPTPYQTTKPVVCASDRMKCSTTCTDLRSDPLNCGVCGNECGKGESCTNGRCMASCSPAKTSCQDGCFDLMSDKDHCGSCLNDCPRGLICYRGQCSAPATPMPVPL